MHGVVLCGVVESSCLPTQSIVPHISWHDPPFCRTTKNYGDFPSMVIFQFSPRKFVIQQWFCDCQQYPCLFHTVFEYIPGLHNQGKMSVLPNQLLYSLLSTFHIGSMFCFFPANLMSSTYTDKTLFHGVRISIPNWKPSPNRTSIGFSQIAFPITVLPQDDHTDFAQEERLGLPYGTMIQAICVVVDESKCLDIPIWDFSIILEHLPF